MYVFRHITAGSFGSESEIALLAMAVVIPSNQPGGDGKISISVPSAVVFPEGVVGKAAGRANARTGTLSFSLPGYRPPGHTGRAGCLRNQESRQSVFPAQGADHADNLLVKTN